MAVELIAKIKQKNGGTFKLVDACDIEMANGQDLETYLKNFSGSGGVCECDPEIYVGPTAPTDPNIKVWVDTSKQTVDSSFSSLIIEEFKTIISSLTEKIAVLEKEVAYLKAVVEPSEPPIEDSNDLLMINENGFVLVNENNQILCFNNNTDTIITAQIMVNENGDILTNEYGNILCFNVSESNVTNTQIMINENNDILVNENGQILCLDTYDMLLVNENYKILVDENNKILKL